MVKLGDVRFNVSLLKDTTRLIDELSFLPDESESEFYARVNRTARNISAGNIGSFFAHLFTGVFGGSVSEKFTKRISLLNGFSKAYSPDVLIRKDGVFQDIEIKSYSTRQGRALLRKKQAESYFLNLLNHLNSEENFDFKYAFFRYAIPSTCKLIKGKKYSTSGLQKYRRVSKSWHPENTSPELLVKNLSSSVRDVLLIPSNLLFLLLSISGESQLGRTPKADTLKENNYWYVRSGVISRLHDPEVGLSSLLDEYSAKLDIDFKLTQFSRNLPSYLNLSGLKSNQFHTSSISMNGLTVLPFKVTSYDFSSSSDQYIWQKNLIRYHRVLLEDVLGINDLFGLERKVRNQLIRAGKFSKPDDEIPF